MRKLTNIIKVLLLVAPAMALSGGFSSCSDPNEGELFITPSDSLTDLTVVDVMESERLSHGNYSEWLQLLKYTNYYNALKNANASATVFCPTNEAIDKFLAAKGVSKVTDLDINYAKAVVQTHIIADIKVTQKEIDDFATKKDYIKTQTLFDSYINLSYGYQKTDVDDADRTDEVYCEDSIFINNDARLGNFDATTCKNGVFYEMADVITPLAETIYETLKADPDYSIFAEAMETCEYDSVANKYVDTTYAVGGARVITKYRYTCFAVPDNVFQAEGINSVSSLVSYLRAHSVEEGSLSDDEVLTHYMQYHFLKREYTTGELFDFMDPGNETLIYEVRLPGDAIVTDMIADAKIINKTVPLLRSDIETRNGYINKVGGVMPVYHPDPVNVKWDFLNQEDIIAFVNAYGAANSLGNLFSSPLTASETKLDISDSRDSRYGDITSFTYKNQASKASASNYRIVGFYKDKYKSAATPTQSQYGCYMNNYLCLNLGYAGYIRFNSPSIIKGKYKIVLHYLTDAMTQKDIYSSGTLTQFKIDEDDEENARSTSQYLYKGVKYSRTTMFQSLEQTLFANIEFANTETHSLRITMLDTQAKNLSSYHQYLDYVEFIPID